MDKSFDEDGRNRCDVCRRQLTVEHDMAGAHLAIRLDCPEPGAQLMWTPFGDVRSYPWLQSGSVRSAVNVGGHLYGQVIDD